MGFLTLGVNPGEIVVAYPAASRDPNDLLIISYDNPSLGDKGTSLEEIYKSNIVVSFDGVFEVAEGTSKKIAHIKPSLSFLGDRYHIVREDLLDGPLERQVRRKISERRRAA